jgi:hypothetical protein
MTRRTSVTPLSIFDVAPTAQHVRNQNVISTSSFWLSPARNSA